MSHLLYLMFRCDGDVMESLDFGVVFEGSKHTRSDEHLCVAKTMITRETGVPDHTHPARPSSRILCGAGASPFETLTVQ